MRRDAPGRRRPPSASRTTLLVYCGGQRTEPAYFDGLRQLHRRSAITVKVRAGGVAPLRLVELAAGDRDRRPGVYDEVWCVVDVDEFALQPAVALAQRRQVNLAISNPCFELWLLLHRDNCAAYCNGCGEVVARLAKHLPGYDKTDLRFADFAAGVGAAVERAKALEPTGHDHVRNPSTNVWRLAERIIQG